MKVLVDKDFLEDGLELICDKVRLKTGGSGVLAFPVEIAEAVESIETGSGGITPTGTKTITENGEGIDVTSFAAVDVAVPTGITPTGTKQITANGTGIDVAQYAAVDVAVPTGITPSGVLPITQNTSAGQTVDVTNYEGVTVNVPSGGYDEVVWGTSGNIATASTSSKMTLEFYMDPDEALGGIYIEGKNRTTQGTLFSLVIAKEDDVPGGWLGWSWLYDNGEAKPGMHRPQVTVTHAPSGNYERYTVEIDLRNQYIGFTTEANNYSFRPLRMR